MDKFTRNYELRVEKEDGNELTVTLPFTLQLDITRNTLTSANVCQLRIYNLSERNRNQIRFNSSDYGKFRKIELRAGYGKNLPRIFRGNISQAWSVREGTNFITQIECYDGGFAFNTGFTEDSFPAGTPKKAIITKLASGLPELELGAIGSYPGVTTRGTVISGNTAAALDELTGGGFFVDDGKANALGTNEYIQLPNSLLYINSTSGLLGTPVLEQTIVRFDMIFEPTLNVGYKIALDSSTGVNFNGDYKVTAVKHRGMISESQAGTLITTGEFFYSKLLSGAL